MSAFILSMNGAFDGIIEDRDDANEGRYDESKSPNWNATDAARHAAESRLHTEEIEFVAPSYDWSKSPNFSASDVVELYAELALDGNPRHQKHRRYH